MSIVDVPKLPLLAHVIGGDRVAGEGTLPVVDPSTGREIATQAVASEEQVDLAVRSAAHAFRSWRRTSATERSELLHRLADAIVAEKETFARLEALDVGKPITAARADMPYHWDVLRYFAGAVRVSHGTSLGEVAPGLHSRVEREPIGVVGLIIPWNAPLLEALWKLAPALAAGNTVVMKVSQSTPCTTTRLFELAMAIFPPGVVNLVLGDSRGGKALAAHPDVSLISLTGSTKTGRQVAAAGAHSLKRMHLELGGKAPVLVHPGIDLAQAAGYIATTGFIGSGQDCTAACRIIVHEAAYDEFVPLYLAEVDQIRVGAGLDEDTTMGPLVSAVQKESVQGFVDRAKTYATLARGGEARSGDGFFVQPTVVLDAAQDSEIIQQEAFGPIVSIQSARDEEQMLSWANDTPYGLAASVWTSDLHVSQRATRELDFGTVWVNTHMQVIPDAPFGGFGDSGYGKELSMMALEECSRFKHVMVQSG